MSENRNVLFLIGSPKKSRSTSESMSDYLAEKIKESVNWNIEKIHILTNIQENPDTIEKAANQSDVIVLAFPTYVDSLPSHVIRALMLMESRLDKTKIREFMVLINCGFPETFHNDNALKICHFYAKQNGLDWRGGIAVGAGGAIVGKKLTDLGGMAGNLMKNLAVLADRLVEHETSEDDSILRVQTVPTRMYNMAGNMGWKKQAQKLGVQDRLYDKPDIKI
ncbi:MAG: NAD(P)H-dependent oxidoreductase [Dethiosulfatibacter sp.]|nr:NAD(P)H-dependent oxidoreductase [Dethiosulfatibacter sp.]